MSQRVNIHFSVDLEELPDEVERLVSKFGDQLVELSEMYSNMSTDVISVAGIEDIEKLRFSLANADHILADVSSIAGGYIRLKTQPEEEQEQPQAIENPFTPNSDTLNGLEEKLKAFSSRMVDEQPPEITNNEQ